MGSISPAASRPQFLVIGAGSRGNAYARAVSASTSGIIAAVADIDDFKRQSFGQKYIWGTQKPVSGQSFRDWKEFVAWESQRRQNVQTPDSSTNKDSIVITGVFICTLDETHASIIRAIAPLNLHILCEKPLALSFADCLSIQQSLGSYPPKVFSIGHVLRYSPHNILLRDLLVNQQVIGEVVSIEHTEPIGWWHFAHSYVRGNWRRATPEGVGSLLTKSCHDIDFLLWLLCSPSKLTGETPHLPSTITSSGTITHFRKAKKPKHAGSATNCTRCPAESDCIYSATKIYRDRWLRKEKDTGWPLKIVVPEIEELFNESGEAEAEKVLMSRLAEDYDQQTKEPEKFGRSWYGRCVYEADNNVVDEQTVNLVWDEESDSEPAVGRGPKQAIFHMTYPTQAQCERRGRIYGSLGEISYDSRTITVHNFQSADTIVHQIPRQNPEIEKSHGGGDWGLAGAFVQAVQAVDEGRMSVDEAQRAFVGCDLQEAIRSHAVVFAAEAARQERQVIHYENWLQAAQASLASSSSE